MDGKGNTRKVVVTKKPDPKDLSPQEVWLED